MKKFVLEFISNWKPCNVAGNKHFHSTQFLVEQSSWFPYFVINNFVLGNTSI
jgi:hypothetical protein